MSPLDISIVLPNSKLFLFPASAATEPELQSPSSSSSTPSPAADVVLRGEVVISSESRKRVGPIRAVWEVARESVIVNACNAARQWGPRQVLARFESEITADDSWIEAGTTKLLFSFSVPSLLPPTTETTFDRTTHTILAAISEPAPEYILGPVPEYEQVEVAVAPATVRSRSARGGSISNWSDWGFDSAAATNAISTSSSSSSTTRSRGSSFSSVSDRDDSVSPSRRSSTTSPLDSNSRRGSDVSSRRESAVMVEAVGSLRRISTASSAAESRRGSEAGSEAPVEAAPKKKGFFSFRRKSSTSSTASRKMSTSSISSDTATSSPRSSVSRSSSFSSLHPKTSTPTKAQSMTKVDGYTIPEFLLPALSACSHKIDVVSCPNEGGEICALDWSKNTTLAGLGRAEKYARTEVCSIGSAINFGYHLSSVPPNTTIHAIRFSLVQKTIAASGEVEEETFHLFKRGSEHLVELDKKPKDGDFVWRGEEARRSDSTDEKSGKLSSKGLRAQAVHAGIMARPDGLKIKTRVRLPTPMIGAVPTSPKLLDNRLARTKHRLRIETYFSVLGEDANGKKKFQVNFDAKAKFPKLHEGSIRRTWVEHDLVLGSCCVTPENVLVPSYSPRAEVSHHTGNHGVGVGAGAGVAGGGSAPRFDMARFTSRSNGLFNPDGTRQMSSAKAWIKDCRPRVGEHEHAHSGQCLCFQTEAEIAKLVGTVHKVDEHILARNESPPALGDLIADLGDMVKSVYIPTEEFSSERRITEVCVRPENVALVVSSAVLA